MLKFLKHPLTRSLDLDDPRTTLLRRRIIQEKHFLRMIYQDWYGWIASSLPPDNQPVLELGSGAGFLDQYIPGLITSEIFPSPTVRIVLDGCTLPFADASLSAIVMIDVFHHIPDVLSFLHEAVRCIKPGGTVLMVEPWVTVWSAWIYSRLHHEPFDPDAPEWAFPSMGPLSGANSALPWIVFKRDRELFESCLPDLSIKEIKVERPFLYLLSGGVSLRSIMPNFTFGMWKRLEHAMAPMNRWIGMFARITLRRSHHFHHTASS